MADPFVNVHANASQIIWDLARHVYNTTRDTDLKALWIGRGWDWRSSEHSTGLALDIIVGPSVGLNLNLTQYRIYRDVGDAVAAWLVKHAETLHIRHIIWNEKIYRTRYKALGPLPGRTSSSNNSDWHRDHIHVFLQDDDGKVPTEPVAAEGKPPVVPGLPTTGVDNWDGKSFPGVKVFDPKKKSDAVKLLQQRLLAHGYSVGKAGADGWFGPDTKAAVRKFQLAQGWTGFDADGIPGPVTWTRLMAAAPTKPKVSLSKLITAFKTDPPKAGTPVSYPQTKLVEAALVREGLMLARYSDGHAGTATLKAYAKWQYRLGYRGEDANGIPGIDSLTKLGKKYGFEAVK